MSSLQRGSFVAPAAMVDRTAVVAGASSFEIASFLAVIACPSYRVAVEACP